MKVALLNLIKSLAGNRQTDPPPISPIQLEPAKKILVVEDEVDLRQLYMEILTQEGFEVQGASNGEEGLSLLLKIHPNLVLLDLKMPIMDGTEMLQKMSEQESSKTVPVIILSNAGDIDTMRDAKFYSNVKTFLIKANVTPPDIVNNVKTIIGQI